jgi:hypothetical protein
MTPYTTKQEGVCYLFFKALCKTKKLVCHSEGRTDYGDSERKVLAEECV